MTKKEFKQKRPLIIAVDCDGTLWLKDVKYPATGTPRMDIIEKVKQLKRNGAFIILWTCRASKDYGPVKEFCKVHSIEYDVINKNYEHYKSGFAKRKIYADWYLDDQAISFNDFLKL